MISNNNLAGGFLENVTKHNINYYFNVMASINSIKYFYISFTHTKFV